MDVKRYLSKFIKNDLKKKIVLISGPRQSGKTTLSKMINVHFDYLNFDYPEHRIDLMNYAWDRDKDLVIFDELHKMKNWKSWLKGIYDVEGLNPKLLVTGSARLDVVRKMGDSLAGRYFLYRLHPFDIKEVKHLINPEEAFNRILYVSGFPEPFLENDITFYNRWKRSHSNIILRQDLLEFEFVKNITSIETLIELLRIRVGSPVSYASLSRDLQHNAKTIKRWLTILENLYIIFSVKPYHKNIARSILKSPKFYFYDTGQVKGDDGCKLENMVACSLLKELHYLEDCFGFEVSMNYLRNKEGKEIDFFISVDNKKYLIEVKWNDQNLSNNFRCFKKYFPESNKIQLVKNIKKQKIFPDKTKVTNVVSWLANLNLKPRQ